MTLRKPGLKIKTRKTNRKIRGCTLGGDRLSVAELLNLEARQSISIATAIYYLNYSD